MRRSIPSDENITLKPNVGPQPPRVLVVEDDPDFAALVRFELEMGGYTVETTSSVSEALRRMHGASDLALVISDVRLPGKSGIELLFPEDLTSKTPPVLMMSAFMSPKLRELVERMGASAIEKPFSFAALHASVIRALRNAAKAKNHAA
jgi:DNA-binding response OmpR family regulator